MTDNVALAVLALPALGLALVLCSLIVTHFLALAGIGEGSPFTAKASQRFYRGDASLLGLVITILFFVGAIYV